MEKNALIFIFYDYRKNKVLIENRVKGQYLEFKKIFPGGKVEPDETNDFNRTLIRECNEEFGIKPVQYKIFKYPVLGESGYWLWPCLIINWTGKMPNRVKDKKSKLEWLNLEEYKTDIGSVNMVYENIKKYITSHNVVDTLPKFL